MITHHIPNVKAYLIKTLRNEDNVLVELTGCDVSRHSCTLNIPIHYCLDTDGVVAISNQVCNVVHVSSSDIRTILSVVVDIHPGHIVADPVLVALHWSVGPVESNAGRDTTVNAHNGGGWAWFCSG